MCRSMTKQTKLSVHPARTQISLGIRSLRCQHEETLGSLHSIRCTVKTLVRPWIRRLIQDFAGCTGHFVGCHFVGLDVVA